MYKEMRRFYFIALEASVLALPSIDEIPGDTARPTHTLLYSLKTFLTNFSNLSFIVAFQSTKSWCICNICSILWQLKKVCVYLCLNVCFDFLELGYCVFTFVHMSKQKSKTVQFLHPIALGRLCKNVLYIFYVNRFPVVYVWLIWFWYTNAGRQCICIY